MLLGGTQDDVEASLENITWEYILKGELHLTEELVLRVERFEEQASKGSWAFSLFINLAI